MESRLSLAKEIGATHVIDTSIFTDLASDLPTAVRKIVPKGANAIFDTTGVVPLIAGAVKALHSKGQIILIDIVNGKSMDLNLGELLNASSIIHIMWVWLIILVWYRYTWMHRRQCEAAKGRISRNLSGFFAESGLQFVPQMIEWYRQGKL